MPIHAVAASAGIIAASITVAAAVAVYQSPEVRRRLEDLRRRIAIALHSLGDGIDPSQSYELNNGEPVLNRSDDTEGFLLSSIGNNGVDADEESRRKQREELMHWNAVREAKKKKNEEMTEMTEDQKPRGQAFDDTHLPDHSGEHSTFVYNTGANVRGDDNGLRRRGGVLENSGMRDLNSSMYANPFADEHGIDYSENEEGHALAAGQNEVVSDIFSVSNRSAPELPSRTLSPQPLTRFESHPENEVLFDFNEQQQLSSAHVDSIPLPNTSSNYSAQPPDHPSVLENQQGTLDSAHTSVQAWALFQGSVLPTGNPAFYSPIPVSPPRSQDADESSEAEMVSEDGMMTPIDSASLAGSTAVEIGRLSDSESRAGDVISDDGMTTPSTWSEIASAAGESDSEGDF